MGVGWVEIFWSIFHRPLKNPAITLDDATFFGETIQKKWQSFSRSKNWNCLPYMLFHTGKAGKPNCFSNIWDLLKKNSQFQFGFPVPVTLFSGQVPGTLQKCGTPRLTSSGCLILWLMIGSGRYTLKISQIYLGFITIHERMEIRSRPTR